MCGRYTFAPDLSQLGELFPGLEPPADAATLAPRYNIAPTQDVPVVRNDGRRRVELVRWGLVPSWAKDPAIGNRMINARAETAAEKPSFRAAFRKRRCLVLADGFYEWQKVPGERTKQPYHVRMKDGRPFAFAGLWEAWRQREGRRRGAAGGAEPGDAGSRQTGAGEAAAGDDWLLTCTILTTAPNDLMKPIHDRMPVILPRGAYDAWLAEGEAPPDEIAALLVPFDPGAMEAYPVSRAVNNPKHDAPELVEPLSGGGPAS